ncbi:hypothetical protein [Rhodococcus sp. IEGM 1318]|uniref:hypothetical protein n=1 Tax=Rhodococcus sp. IEGM 1318 TaxID=3082226 RepID=UPI0029539FD7|nr:hypothetical protein [Rhodococcus sp. IEGM 1318]MDV8005028.1 hypothetical protein [Rhodococcus sp. IEGM 1318]
MSEIRSQATPARDERAALLADELQTQGATREFARYSANALVSAGWSKPRTVETPDDLDELPPGSVIRGEFLIWEKNLAGTWLTPGVDKNHHKTSTEVVIAEAAPIFTVLFTPGDAT